MDAATACDSVDSIECADGSNDPSPLWWMIWETWYSDYYAKQEPERVTPAYLDKQLLMHDFYEWVDD